MFPWFLIGLVATAIPVIIHLLQLRRPKRVLFTNNAFIREVELVAVRHRQLQHLLILGTRVLGIVALVLLFCQPFIPGKKPTDSTTGVDVLVDNSYSMQRRAEEQGILFTAAAREAERIGKTAPSVKRFRLLNDGNAQLSYLSYMAKLAEIKLTSYNPFAKIHGNGIEPKSDSRRYLISDFQKKSFNERILNELGNGQTILVPLTGKETGNIYVDSVWLDDAFVRIRTNVGLHIRVRNGGTVAVRNCPVKVFLGAKQVSAYQVSVEPGQSATQVVQVQVSDGALALGRVVTEDFPVTFDDAYYFTLRPAAAIRVIEIGEKPVLQPLYANEPLFNYSFVNSQNIDYNALRQANLIFVRELGQVDAGMREALRNVLKRGGSVVVVPSAASAGHDSYALLFKELGLGAVQWEAQVEAPELREVAMPSAREPFFRDVFGAQQRGVTMPRVAPVLRWSRTGTDILRLRDGESYLANFASGAGQVYVFSAPFAEKYSDFVSHALFVPVMYRLAMLSYQNEQLPAYRLTQGTVNLKLPMARVAGNHAESTDEASFRLVRDSLSVIPAQRVVGNDLRLELPAGMDAPGFYELQQRGKTLTTLAFNPDRQESELAVYSADELRQMIGPNRPNIRVVEAGKDGVGLAKFEAEQTGQPLWRYFVVLALCCLLAEALLIRFGRTQAGAKKVAVTA
nr:BatA domain-containing protein [Hymenobacter rubidus]